MLSYPSPLRGGRASEASQGGGNANNYFTDTVISLPSSTMCTDLRATIGALIVANSFLETKVEELMKAVSHAYVRGRFQTYAG